MLVVVAVLAASGPATAGGLGAIAIPSLAVEVGAGTPLGQTSALASSTELRVGASFASLYWKPTSVDFTIGYVGSYRSPPSEPYAARTTGMPVESTLQLHGAYLEAAHAVETHRHWRTWLAARVETLAGDYEDRRLNVVGGAVRIGTELYAAGGGAAGGGNALAVFAGAVAIGVYVEGTARTLPKELGPLGVGAGVSMRLPFIAAIGG
jgi:hypothetical protein